MGGREQPPTTRHHPVSRVDQRRSRRVKPNQHLHIERDDRVLAGEAPQPGRAELARTLASRGGEACRLAPATTLAEMMAMIACHQAFVGADTAAMHMAWLQGVPTALFSGPKPLRTIAPLPPVPWRGLVAAQHYREGLKPSRQSLKTVSEVGIEQAAQAVHELLGRTEESE